MKQLTTHDVTLTPGAALQSPDLMTTSDTSSLRGFGGLHGGLVLALCATSMSPAPADQRPLRHITGQFHRRVRDDFEITKVATTTGRQLTHSTATATHDERTLVNASATFGDPKANTTPHRNPPTPSVEPPERYDPLRLPAELVPIAQHFEIRPVDHNLPYMGGDDPTLTAWIRFTEDDQAPDELRLITLIDALAPSYAALLTSPVEIPTIELSVRLAPSLKSIESPWILLRARTHAAADGWIDERIDAWSESGTYVGAGTQVRLIRT